MNIDCIQKDCGFDEKSANQYREAVVQQNYYKQLQILEIQRKIALNEMHSATRRLDCIDYMICECKEKQEAE